MKNTLSEPAVNRLKVLSFGILLALLVPIAMILSRGAGFLINGGAEGEKVGTPVINWMFGILFLLYFAVDIVIAVMGPDKASKKPDQSRS